MVKNWDLHKSEIYSLYISDGRSLDDVRRILKGRHNFNASIRSFRTKLEEWGMKKNKVAKNPGHKNKTTRSTKSLSKNGSNPAAEGSSTVLDLDRNLTSLLSLPALQCPNMWPMSLSLSDNLNHDFNDSNVADIATFRNLSSMEHGDGIQEFEYVSFSELFNAISNKDIAEVKKLLSNGTSVNVRDKMGKTPLHVAVLKGSFDIVKSLLDYGADVDTADVQRKTPIHLAVTFKPLIKLLLKQSPKLSLQDDHGNTVLHYLLNIRDWYMDEDSIATIRLLLSSGADINITNSLGESPLHRVVSDAIPESLEYMKLASEFLDHDPEVISPMRNGSTLLSVFLSNTSYLDKLDDYPSAYWKVVGTQCLEKFLMGGAEPNIIFHSRPFIIEYLSKKFFYCAPSDKVVLQLAQRANIDVMGPGGNYPLHLVLELTKRQMKDYPQRPSFDIYSIIATLLSRNVNASQTNDKDVSPLEICLREGETKDQMVEQAQNSLIVKVILLLVRSGADTMMPTSTGKTFFDMLNWLQKDDQHLLTKAFLKSGAITPNIAENNAERLEWVETWRTAWKQCYWQGAKAQLGELQESMSRPKCALFMNCATLIIMEHQLEAHKSSLKLWKEGLVEKETVVKNYKSYCAILRDCRERDFEIDVSWYTFLLDLMDFKSN